MFNDLLIKQGQNTNSELQNALSLTFCCEDPAVLNHLSFDRVFGKWAFSDSGRGDRALHVVQTDT